MSALPTAVLPAARWMVAALLCTFAACTLAACTAPRLPPRHDTPADTLLTWQSGLRHDDPQAEYACLSVSLQRRLLGFENYYAARTALLRDNALAAWLFSRADLAARIVETSYSADGRNASVTLRTQGEPLTVLFEREAWVQLHWDDGTRKLARQERPMDLLLGSRDGSQWLFVERPPFGDPQRLRELHLHSRWLISDLAGLGGTAPPADLADHGP